MTGRADDLVRELKRSLQDLYGARLQGVYVYGSYARGEQESGSDLDVLVVLDKLADYGDEIDRTSQLVSDLSLKYDISISRAFVSQRDWGSGRTPFLLNVREEAVPVAARRL